MFPEITEEENEKRVSAYYRWSALPYRMLWSTPDTLAMHIGFWDKDTYTLADALLRENKFLAEKAHISESDLVLDAGCGIGGSAIWISKNIGAKVIGIANERGLVECARRNAAKHNIKDKTVFELQNYNHTNFLDNTFDVVWAIESFDYAPDKKALFEEVWRVLKPGGRLIVADFFQNRRVENKNEQKIFNDITLTLAVYQTQWWGEYIPILRELGFKNVNEFDKTEAVRPSSRRLNRLGLAAKPIVYLFLYPFRFSNKYISALYDNWRCSVAIEKAFRLGLIKYGVYYAEK